MKTEGIFLIKYNAHEVAGNKIVKDLLSVYVYAFVHANLLNGWTNLDVEHLVYVSLNVNK